MPPGCKIWRYMHTTEGGNIVKRYIAVALASLAVLTGCGTAKPSTAEPAGAPASTPSSVMTPGPVETSPVKTPSARPTTQAPKATGPIKPGTALHKQLCSATERQADVSQVTGTPWKKVKASTFYIGEEAGPSNAGIDNIATAWDEHAATSFGGVDRWGPKDPDAPNAYDSQDNWYPRTGLCPAGVTLRQNPFYLALPTPDYDEHGPLTAALTAAAKRLPELHKHTNGTFPDGTSPFKDLWVQVSANGRTAFAQLEDIGPSDKTGAIVGDYDYVWGSDRKPQNKFGMEAGIDLSPALAMYLNVAGEGDVSWRFVPADQVPAAWKLLVTSGPPNWS